MTKTNKKKQIPAPPDANASWEEQAAYHEKYSMQELEEAGYLVALSEEEQKGIEEMKAEARRRIAARKARR